MDSQKNSVSNLGSYSQREWAMFLGFPIIKTIGVLPTQPLVKIATEQQKSVAKKTGQLNFIQAIRQVHAIRGFKGFFDGSVASMSREGFKTSYKGILQVSANDFSTHMVQEGQQGAFLLKGIISGGLVGVLDPTIAAPIERYKTFKISQDTSGNILDFLKDIKNQQGVKTGYDHTFGVIQELYRGLGVTIAKQTLMNVAFFTTKAFVDPMAKPYKNDYPLMSIAFTSLSAGAGAALVGAPLDVVKTLKQQNTGNKTSTKKLLTLVVSQSGFKGLFAGVPARFALITFGYGLNGLFLNLFEMARTKQQEVDSLSTDFSKLSIIEQAEKRGKTFLPSQGLKSDHGGKKEGNEQDHDNPEKNKNKNKNKL